MNEELRSILLGTAGLDLAAAASLLLSVARPPRAAAVSERNRVRRIAAAAIVLQSLHFSEEWSTGFHVRFPQFLGLVPWPSSFFVTFNLVWIAIWTLSAMLLRLQPRLLLFPIWFLAIGSVANGVAHPLLAAAAGGYFPGLWTSPLVGIAGVVLLKAVSALTRPQLAR